jgi:NTE family protein
MSAGTAARTPVNLALQGGGAHGAFTWGVLDAILEDGRLEIKAITGTSAGAMNAVVLADGYLEGGPEGARQQLDHFWREVSREGLGSPLRRSLFERMMGSWSRSDLPGFAWFDAWTRAVSPYDFNPLDLNPLRDFLERIVDFPRLRREPGIALFIAATNVSSGKIRVFERHELTGAMVMASACLPQLFHAVIVKGEAYWDGGFMGNPALFPLFYADTSDDTILVQINPIRIHTLPRRASEIQSRLNEITANASLLSEFRAIAFVKKLLATGVVSRERYRDVRLHRIALDHAGELDAASRLDTDWDFLTFLRDRGRHAGKAFLAADFERIGKDATLDLDDPAI